MQNKRETICAIVVTYNRKDFLSECLKSLLKQTYPFDIIYIIDNASTDGTPQDLKEKGYIKEILESKKEPVESEHTIHMLTDENKDKIVKVYYVRMQKNTGGAGGFYEGIKRGYGRGCDWLWLMDDDTIVLPNTLEEFVKALVILEKENIGFLTSKAVWTDGSEHRMNIPWFSLKEPGFSKYLDHGYLPVRTASFVSMLVSKTAIKKVGFPIREYFVYTDDVEYSSRISKYYKCYFVSKSKVVHNTKYNDNFCGLSNNINLFYFMTRNRFWVIKSGNFSPKEKLKLFFTATENTLKLLRHDFSFKNVFFLLKAIIKVLFSSPKQG